MTRVANPVDILELGALAQPEWNRADSVARAVRAVAEAHDKSSSRDAYNAFLYAVGNNHAGTFFPVVVDALHPLLSLLTSSREWTQYTVVEVLIDLVGSFQPEPGYEWVRTRDGQDLRVDELVVAAIRAERTAIERLAASTSLASRGAAELLQSLAADP
jgi:hypothetical protein